MSATEPRDISVIAFNKMRQGLLFILIGWLLLGLSLMLVFMGIFMTVGAWTSPPSRWVFAPLIGGFILGLIALIVGGVLSLFGFYLRFIPGVSDLSFVSHEYSTASKLIKVGYVGGLTIVLVGAVLLPFIPPMGFGLFALGLILLVLGHIGMVVLCLKLNNVEGDSLYLISGILFIVSIFVPILIVVSVILLYIALGDSIRKRTLAQKPATT
ncbi:MAG: hypothetical protein QXD94_05095 [Sulfolobales archaeon]